MINISVTYGLLALLLVTALGLVWVWVSYDKYVNNIYTLCRILVVLLIATTIGGILVW